MSTSFTLTLTGPAGQLFSWSPEGMIYYPADPSCRRLAADMLEHALKALREAPAALSAPSLSPLDRLREAGLARARRDGWGFVLVDPAPDMIEPASIAFGSRLAAWQTIPVASRRLFGVAVAPSGGDVENPIFTCGLLRPSRVHSCIVDVPREPQVHDNKVLSFQRLG